MGNRSGRPAKRADAKRAARNKRAASERRWLALSEQTTKSYELQIKVDELEAKLKLQKQRFSKKMQKYNCMTTNELQAKADEFECQRAVIQAKSDELQARCDQLQTWQMDEFDGQLAVGVQNSLAMSDELQAKSDELQAKADELQTKSDEVECQRADIQAKSDKLRQIKNKLQAKADELQTKSDEFECQRADLSDELQTKSDELQAKADELQAKSDELTRQHADLQSKQNELQARSDEVQAKSNADTADAMFVHGFAKCAQIRLEQLRKTVIRLKEQLVLKDSKHLEDLKEVYIVASG